MNVMKRLERIVQESGFTHWKRFDASILEFREDVREMCAADRCHAYGRRWSCPPACGTLEELRKRAGAYPAGILVQTVGRLEDSFDYDGMMRAEAEQKKKFFACVRRAVQEEIDVLPMGCGACGLCEQCTYPEGRPCRHPELAWPSMEACGLLVSDVCGKAGLNYYYGPDTVAFTSCILVKAPSTCVL